MDNTHVLYLSEHEAEMRKAKRYDGNDLKELSKLGIPIAGNSGNK